MMEDSLRGDYLVVWQCIDQSDQGDACDMLLHQVGSICATLKARFSAVPVEWQTALYYLAHIIEGFSGKPVRIPFEQIVQPYMAISFGIFSTNDSATELLTLCREFYSACAEIVGIKEGFLLDGLSTGIIALKSDFDENWLNFERLIQIHSVRDGENLNLHTHGLVKFARPELELNCPLGTDVEQSAHQLLIAAYHSINQEPPVHGRIQFHSQGESELHVWSQHIRRRHFNAPSTATQISPSPYVSSVQSTTLAPIRREYFYGSRRK